MSEDELSDILIKSGLNILGKHPLTQSHTYLELKCNNQNIKNISKLKNYQYLLYLDLSNNQIDELTPLENIKCLIQLRLSSNNLTDCLRYSVPQCNIDNIWSTGHSSIGSMLTLVDLSNNFITKIDNLSNHPFIEVLLLSKNKISRIEGIENLKYLKVLDLSYNNISEITGLDYLNIQELDLSFNNIKSLSGLNNLLQLSVLKITNNNISSLGPLSSSQQLYHIDIEYNTIEYIRQVEFLYDIRWLKILKLRGNPCCNKLFYRYRVVYRLPNLNLLDSTIVSSEEKIRAMNMYLSSDGDLQERADIFYKYFPNDEFHSYTYNFIDDENELTAKFLYDCGIDPINDQENVFKIGSIVLVDFRLRGRWYPGIITNVRDDGYYDIEYDDGDIELRVDSKNMKVLTDDIVLDSLNNTTNITSTSNVNDSNDSKNNEISDENKNTYEVGSKVLVDFRLRGRWYPGIVSNVRDDGFYDIEYEDGDIELRVESQNMKLRN